MVIWCFLIICADSADMITEAHVNDHTHQHCGHLLMGSDDTQTHLTLIVWKWKLMYCDTYEETSQILTVAQGCAYVQVCIRVTIAMECSGTAAISTLTRPFPEPKKPNGNKCLVPHLPSALLLPQNSHVSD